MALNDFVVLAACPIDSPRIPLVHHAKFALGGERIQLDRHPDRRHGRARPDAPADMARLGMRAMLAARSPLRHSDDRGSCYERRLTPGCSGVDSLRGRIGAIRTSPSCAIGIGISRPGSRKDDDSLAEFPMPDSAVAVMPERFVGSIGGSLGVRSGGTAGNAWPDRGQGAILRGKQPPDGGVRDPGPRVLGYGRSASPTRRRNHRSSSTAR